MKPFHTIAIPHPDIRAHQLSMDAFAADLWDVHQGRAAETYATAETFFQQTYMTEALTQLFATLELRLRQKRGEPVISLQAASGYGKTHALIAAYHQAKCWNVRPVVIIGTALQATETLWGVLEEQLTGTRRFLRENTAPGRNALRQLLSKQGTAFILIDELLPYITKAATIQIGESNLAAQTFVFLQELSETLSSSEQHTLIMTLPSGALERYDQQSEWFFAQIQRIFSARDKILMPIQEHEIPHIVRKRLYPTIDEDALRHALDEFMRYAVQESLIPSGVEPKSYHYQMAATYPFLPEVFSVLQRRWGNFPGFRGVCSILRILALVLEHCQNQPLPYLTLADMDLTNHDIRRELLRHVGAKFEQIIMTEWLADNATISRADTALAKETTSDIKLVQRAATAIFLASFSENDESGISVGEIKRHALIPPFSTRLMPDLLRVLQEQLHFLHVQHNTYRFSLQPNLNYLLLKSMEHVTDHAIQTLEREVLHKTLPGKFFEVARWPHASDEIPDTPALKLVVLNTYDEEFMRQLIARNGRLPRVNQNTLFFLTPDEHRQNTLTHMLAQYLAWGMLLAETEHAISDEQKKLVKLRWKAMETDLEVVIRQHYCRIVIPEKDGLAFLNVGTLRSETQTTFEEDIYALLVSAGEIIEELPVSQIQEYCLKNKPFVFTEQLFRASTTVLGEPRMTNRSVCENAVKRGVLDGAFGLGILKGKQLICNAFKQEVFYMNFSEDEVIIRSDLCVMPEGSSSQAVLPPEAVNPPQSVGTVSVKQMPMTSRDAVHLRLPFFKHQTTIFMGLLYSLQQHFGNVVIEIHADEGQISEPTYQQQIEEIIQRIRQ
ncbi:ATPase (AAA+ superfamily)-like protein [Candidatus Moduliflexus flocculans]|uniref:ATPase (AAA+ superfamily)-like protein n=1 Tax=Candidatus Moduliflexus flocculans TaxID=1499966 RepID=A0A081BLY1_9BACT|nr:ATPase (AAA+ superfamily)-like protein [Candidatus Moduliflexus flocculans]